MVVVDWWWQNGEGGRERRERADEQGSFVGGFSIGFREGRGRFAGVLEAECGRREDEGGWGGGAWCAVGAARREKREKQRSVSRGGRGKEVVRAAVLGSDGCWGGCMGWGGGGSSGGRQQFHFVSQPKSINKTEKQFPLVPPIARTTTNNNNRHQPPSATPVHHHFHHHPTPPNHQTPPPHRIPSPALSSFRDAPAPSPVPAPFSNSPHHPHRTPPPPTITNPHTNLRRPTNPGAPPKIAQNSPSQPLPCFPFIFALPPPLAWTTAAQTTTTVAFTGASSVH
ncbi:pollen-specific leucine-rich repeat extensin-like protein 1 [Spinacia oleracea]|uniref:Pollen-specific leucine-rich repeat extensin-like protein 1 n=1 Tax=Spinacia oleracea TaxID=3562 RepID=A0ABM3R969_SPIOL|nr:pollen-specific leucine-rich repeat extensin-like protein 1 [Spinacia oleracea]